MLSLSKVHLDNNKYVITLENNKITGSNKCFLYFSEEKREQHRLDMNLYKSSDYDRLALSLISPLPNEQDFAINVCTLLSNDNRHNLKLDKHPRIVTYLLAHAGIFNHSKYENYVSFQLLNLVHFESLTYNLCYN